MDEVAEMEEGTGGVLLTDLSIHSSAEGAHTINEAP